MDGTRPLLRQLFIASLAWSGQAALFADDFIRPPARSQSTTVSRPANGVIMQPTRPASAAQPAANPSSAGETQPTVVAPSTSAVANQTPVAAQTLQPTQVVQQPQPANQVSKPVTNQVVSPTSTTTTTKTTTSPSAFQRPVDPRYSTASSGDSPGAPTRVGLATQKGNTTSIPAQTAATRSRAVTKPESAWQPRGSGFKPSIELDAGTAHNDAQVNLSSSSARPQPSVFVDRSQAFQGNDLPEVPAEVSGVVQPEAPRDMRLVMEPGALDAMKAEEGRLRQELAARISEELAPGANVSASGLATRTAPGPIEPGAGWQAVGDQLKTHLAKCEQLLSRKAYLSAMEESRLAIVQLVRAVDLRQNRYASEPAWARAQQAFKEADEFTSVQRVANDAQLFARLIESHETPTLKNTSVREITPLAAAQHYRAYAEQCLVEASQGHPWFSELYYCLGRSIQAQAENSQPQSEALLQQSLSYFRAAYAIQPSNATNANQMGYVLLRMDRPAEAIAQLGEAVQLPNCPLEAWQNLAQAGQRIGDKRVEQWAVQNYVTLKSQGAQPSGPVNTLLELDPQQFAMISPPAIGPGGAAPLAAPMQSQMGMSQQSMMNTSPAAAPQAVGNGAPNRTATTPRFGIFR